MGKTRTPSKVISFRCILRDRLGHVLSSSYENQVLTDEATVRGAPLHGLQRGLHGVQVGERRLLLLTADEAFGFYDQELLVEISRKRFPGGTVEVGTSVLAETEDGDRRLYRVVGLTGTHVTLDGNHPFAGQDLIAEIEATRIRDATAEELRESNQEASPSTDGGPRPAVEVARPGPRGYLH